MEQRYISVDIEGTVGGEFPPVSSMVSIGACVIGNPKETFYIELKPISDKWDIGAEAIHKLSREHLERYGMNSDVAMRAFRFWIQNMTGSIPPVFCATPIAYDWIYVKWYFDHFQVPNPFVRTLDGRELYRNIKGLGSTVKVPRMQIWNEFPTSLPHTHNALDDALEQEEVFRQMLQTAGLLETKNGK